MQLATKVVGKSTIIVMDAKESRTDLTHTQLLLLVV